ncbi:MULTISPECIES: EamA family transporter [unclassified Roseitalea]|uniref:DMT family transporter n=1 Tax=unclassified Roseitalea TaxID=2639107 RepID=UPI00273FC104|nr:MULTISPECIES: EamA family transporter [unclassified Roseitalea]
MTGRTIADSGFAGPAIVALAAALWGTAGPASRVLLETTDLDAPAIGFVRLAIAGPALLAVALALPAVRIGFARRHRMALAMIGVGQAAYQGLYFGAVERVGVSMATIAALGGAPVLVALLAALVLGERIDRPVVLAIALAGAGVVLLVGIPDAAAPAGDGTVLGLFMALGAALAYAVFALAARSLAPHHHPLAILAVGFTLGTAMLAPAALAGGLPLPKTPTGWLLAAFIGLVSTCLAYGLFFFGMRTTSATMSGVLVLIEPLTASLLAALVFGERLGPLGYLGGLLLGAAVVVLARPWRAAAGR